MKVQMQENKNALAEIISPQGPFGAVSKLPPFVTFVLLLTKKYGSPSEIVRSLIRFIESGTEYSQEESVVCSIKCRIYACSVHSDPKVRIPFRNQDHFCSLYGQ